MTNATRALTLLALLPACQVAESTDGWSVVHRSQQGNFESFEVRTAEQTYMIMVHHDDALTAIAPAADILAADGPDGVAYFDGSGAELVAEDVSDPVVVELLDAAVANELGADEPTFRRDAVDVGRDVLIGICHAGCDSLTDVCLAGDSNGNDCFFGWLSCHAGCG